MRALLTVATATAGLALPATGPAQAANGALGRFHQQTVAWQPCADQSLAEAVAEITGILAPPRRTH
ncbi:hypothetical protein ACWENQ_43640 [Nonomuraea sp. NPDC004354]